MRELDTSPFPESALSTKILVGHLNTLIASGMNDADVTACALDAIFLRLSEIEAARG